MGRPPILPVSAAVAAVALGASPGLVAVNPAGKHKENEAITFPLLALASSNSTARPSGHVSHSSHSSHVSHYSSSHSSHGSHYSHHSHYSSSPSLPPPSPTPAVTQSSPTQAQSPRPPGKKKHHARNPGSTRTPSHSPTPSPSQSSPSAVPSISPSPVSSDSSAGGAIADVVVALLVIGGVTVYVVRRKNRSR